MLLLLGTALPAYAEDAADSESATPEADSATDTDEEEKKTSEASGVTTAARFPNAPTLSFPVGEYADALVGLSNNAPDQGVTYRIEFILAYLTARDGSYYVQNFTGAAYNRSVNVGESATMRYRFKPDAQLDTREYTLLVQVFYMNDDNETFLATPFNGTISLTEADLALDGRTIFGYASTFGIIALAGGALYTKYFAGAKSSRGGASSGGAKSTDGIDWDYVPKEHRQYVRARSHTPKQNTQKQ
jgi:hypothetical protein